MRYKVPFIVITSLVVAVLSVPNASPYTYAQSRNVGDTPTMTETATFTPTPLATYTHTPTAAQTSTTTATSTATAISESSTSTATAVNTPSVSATATPSNLRSEAICEALLAAGEKNLSYCQFRNLEFGNNSNVSTLHEYDFRFSVFENVRFIQTDLISSNLQNVRLVNVDFNIFYGLSDNDFTNATCKCVFTTREGNIVDIANNIFANADFRYTRLIGKFDNSDYTSTGESGRYRRGLDFTNANIAYADFSQMRFLDASGGTAPGRYFYIKLKSADVESVKLPQYHQDLYIVQPCNITGNPAPGYGVTRIQTALFGLKNMDYSGCDLRNHVVQNRTIEGANFTGTDLRGANFANTTFRNTTFSTAKLDTTNFATSRFIAPVHTKGYTGTPQLPPGYRSINGYIVGANMVLDDINLNGLDLSDMNLSGSILNDTNIGNANLTNVRLNSAQWLNVDVGTSNLTDADVTGALLVGDFHQANLRGVRSGDTCFGGTLPTGYMAASQSPVSICNNADAQVRGYLVGPGVDLSSRDLSGITMAGVDFSDADLRRANLSYANLNDTDLTGADLTSAVLYGTYLNNADISGARLLGVATSKLRGTPVLPSGYALVQGYIIGPSVDLYGARIVNATLTNMDLSDSDLTGATLTNSDLSGTDLSGASMVRMAAAGSKFVGSDLTRANLSRANLTSSNLQTATLTDADLAGATITGANFGNATFNGIKSGKLVGNPSALPTGYEVRNGYFVGVDANLTNAVLTGANLAGVNLSQARMTGVKSGGIKGTPLLPSGVALRNGFIVGPGANLIGANLSRQSLAGLNLSSVNMSNAIIDGADLTGSN